MWGQCGRMEVKQTEKKPQMKASSQLLSTLDSQGALLNLSEKPQVMQQNWPLNNVEEEVWVGHQIHFCLICIPYTQPTDIFRWLVLHTGVLTTIRKQSRKELATCNATLTFHIFQILKHFGLQVIDSYWFIDLPGVFYFSLWLCCLMSFHVNIKCILRLCVGEVYCNKLPELQLSGNVLRRRPTWAYLGMVTVQLFCSC